MATFMQFVARYPEKHKRHYLLTGEVLPLKIEAVKMIRDMVQPGSMDHVRLDANTDSYADIMSALHLQALEGHNRLVVVWNADALSDWSKIMPLLYDRHDWNSYTVFISNEDNPRREGGPGVYKEFAELGRLVECRHFTDDTLSEFIQTRLKVDSDAAYELMSRCSFDTNNAINAINILSLFDNVDHARIAELIHPQGAFELAEAIWDDISWGLRCDVSAQDWPKILGLLTLVITRLAMAFELGERVTARELAEATGLEPFVAIQILRLKEKLPRRRLSVFADMVAQAELMRRGGASRGLLEWLVISFSVAKAI